MLIFSTTNEGWKIHIGISNKYNYVICGHIHQPEIRTIENDQGKIIYLNSGDWIENLTALEYVNSAWSLYKFDESLTEIIDDDTQEEDELDNNKLFDNMLAEFNLMRN